MATGLLSDAVPNSRLTREDVQRIAVDAMADDARNDRITLAYHQLSQQMAEFLGDSTNANWCTFAVWGSRSSGSGIRTEALPIRLAEGLKRLPLPAVARQRALKRMAAVRGSGGQLPARSLAAGNRGVFFEMGMAYVAFFELFAPSTDGEADRHDTEALLDDLLALIPEIPAAAGSAWPNVDRSLVRRGFSAYLEARSSSRSKARAEWMLLGNLCLAEYEQRRLQTLLTLAVTEPRERFTRGSRKRARSASSDQAWLQFATHRLLAVELADEVLPVDVDLRSRSGEPFLPPTLREITNRDLRELLARLDPFHLDAPPDWDGEETAVANWIDIDQRLRYVAALFRSRQQSSSTWSAPFGEPDERRVLSGRAAERVASPTATPPWLGERGLTRQAWDDLRMRSDPHVDVVVEQFWQQNAVAPEHRRFDTLMGELAKPDATMHPVIRSYLQKDLVAPAWADADRVHSGREFYRRLRLPINLALLVGSLPEAYAAAKGVRVLELVSNLVTDPKRRIGQTAQFVHDMTLHDPLDPTSVATSSIKGVRLMHAAVRHMIEVGGYGFEDDDSVRPAAWDHTLGMPINQEDMLGTMLSFCVPPLDFATRCGFLIDRRAAEDYVHLWCVVGAMLGIEEHLLVDQRTDDPRTLSVAQAQGLAQVIRMRHHEASTGGQLLMLSLEQELQNHTPRPLRPVPGALIRAAIGDTIADGLLVQPRGVADWCVDRSVGIGNRLATHRWYRWLMPKVVEQLGERWYRIFAMGGYGASPQFRRGMRFTQQAHADREAAVIDEMETANV